jgi:hypothetical protein
LSTLVYSKYSAEHPNASALALNHANGVYAVRDAVPLWIVAYTPCAMQSRYGEWKIAKLLNFQFSILKKPNWDALNIAFMFVEDRFGGHKLIDAEVIKRNIDVSFPGTS